MMAAAVGGLRRASAQAAEAAERIAGVAPAADPAPGRMPEAAAVPADPGLAVVDLLRARQAYAANALVVRVADEVAGELPRRLR
jgi:hypothetical protein